jgi:hypothetical protein
MCITFYYYFYYVNSGNSLQETCLYNFPVSRLHLADVLWGLFECLSRLSGMGADPPFLNPFRISSTFLWLN